MKNEELEKVLAIAEQWTKAPYDAETQAAVKAMIEAEDKTELIDSFYRTLEFGTGGLRGLMGPGTNRMNQYIVAQATQGYANYLLKVQREGGFTTLKGDTVSVVVGHDCRNNGRLFAETVAAVFAANGIKVYLFESLRPTPEVSFAIRHLAAQGGVNVTASHNPKEYNGYKAYWEDGSQVLQPHDQGIIDEVNKVTLADVKMTGNEHLIEIIGGEMDYDYMQAVKTVMIDQETILRQKDLNIVYTPLHGAGRQIIPMCLRSWGFENIHVVPEQMVIDGNFSTVQSPNPENAEAMTMGMNLGTQLNADLVIASDPDADRIAIVCRNDKGEWTIGLGAGKWRVIRTVVLPNCVEGVITGCILSVGRIVGESAALLFTAGFAHALSGFFESLSSSGATLTVALYVYATEEGNFEVAFAIAAILMILTLLINLSATLIGKYFERKNKA